MKVPGGLRIHGRKITDSNNCNLKVFLKWAWTRLADYLLIHISTSYSSTYSYFFRRIFPYR